MDLFIIGAIFFIVSVVMIELFLYAFKNMRSTNRARIKKRLRKFIYEEDKTGHGTILKKRIFSEIPLLNTFLLKMPGLSQLDNLVIQANASYPLGFYGLMALLLGAVGTMTGLFFNIHTLLSLLIGLVLMCFPYFYLKWLKQERIKKFKSQFHEGLDLIARALKSGQAFTGGMKLAADEFDAPLGTEFGETLDEINFGVTVRDALKHLADRVDYPEIKYFVIAVIIQRETGGNLAELIESLAHLIRQNFKFQADVRTLTAEGRLSAIILCALPFFVLAWIQFSTPQFLAPLFSELIGKIMLGGAGIMMVIGMLVMRQMVKIDV